MKMNNINNDNDYAYNTDKSLSVLRKHASEDFEFPIDFSDTLFTLTIKNTSSKENVGDIISKMIVINEERLINLHTLSKVLAYMDINELNIFSIDNDNLSDTINITEVNNGCKTNYTEVKPDVFTRLLNYNGNNFLEYNKYSLYLLRGGNYIGIKNLFSSINHNSVNLGRWRESESSYIKSLGSQIKLLYNGYV